MQDRLGRLAQMDPLSALVAGRRASTADDPTLFRPEIFDPANATQREDLSRLLADESVVVHDTLHEQLLELVGTLNPQRELSHGDRQALVVDRLGARPAAEYGRWVFYPWSKRLLHLLPPTEYFALRTDRNRYKILPAEQDALRTKTIGVVGLSVGQATALTLAMEGVGGRFRLADFDALSLSNMNRLRSGAHNIGLPKVVLAAREMFEIDPYLEIEIFPMGLEEKTLAAFFLEGTPIDLLVEECDDLYIKIRAREYARSHRIPVIMETSDRGMLDVERFDLEPNRPFLHGLVGDLQADSVRGMTTLAKIPYVLRILDESRLSKALAASILEVRHSISTWPQLASAVALGGAVVTDVARRIFLGHFEESGRYYVDLGQLVTAGMGVPVAMSPLVPELAPETMARVAVARPKPCAEARVSPDEVRYLVYHATLAPSAGNAQPWRFVFTGDELRGSLAEASRTGTDGDESAPYLALGAAAENLELAAGAIGLVATIEPFPEGTDSRHVFTARFRRSAGLPPPPLFERIVERFTNQRVGPRQPLTEAERVALLDAAREVGAELDLVEDDTRLGKVALVLGEAERVRLLSRALHEEYVGSLRWSAKEVLATRTGIDVATLELDATRLALLRVVSKWATLQTVRAAGGGAGLARARQMAVASASAVGLLRLKATGRSAFFAGGRAAQHVWLRATEHGLSLQPFDLIHLFTRFRHHGPIELAPADIVPPTRSGATLDAGAREALAALEQEFQAIFTPRAGSAIMLFRINHAAPPTARSLRHSVDEILTFSDAR